MSGSASAFNDGLLANERGSVALPIGLSITVLMACVGGAIDYNRWHSAKRVTADAVDAAVLAGARALQTSGGDTSVAIARATSFYQNNTAGRVDLSVNTISFAMTDNNAAITATGTAKIKTSFLGILGIGEMTVLSDTGSGLAKASYSIGGQGGSNIEIALMLDVTGSMCDGYISPCTSGAKITGLKEAAKKLVDLVIPTTQSQYYAKMSLVPFATRVRVGPDGGGGGMMMALTNLPSVRTFHERVCQSWSFSQGGGGGEWGGDSWTCTSYATVQRVAWRLGPCVTDRHYNNGWVFDYTDDAPAGGRWLNAQDGTRRPVGPDSSNTTFTTGTGTAADPAEEQWNYTQTGQCYDMDAANEIMPLTTDKQALKARIDGLVASGSTSGVLGTAWTWYTLSPNWSVWTGNSRPASYADITTIQSNNRPLLRKVAILMTDGVYNTYRGWPGADEAEMATAAKRMCTEMKAKGIEIFTVGLGLNELSTSQRTRAEDILRSCGSDVTHFYSTLNAQELQIAFQDIAYQLGGIALKR